MPSKNQTLKNIMLYIRSIKFLFINKKMLFKEETDV